MTSSLYNIDRLRQYVKGELSSTQMYEIERASHEDEMLMDIILGLEFEQQQVSKANVNLTPDTEKQKENIKSLFNTRYLAIAASLIAFISAGIFFYQRQPLQQETKEVTVVEVAPEEKISVDSTEIKVNEPENLVPEKKSDLRIVYHSPTTPSSQRHNINKINPSTFEELTSSRNIDYNPNLNTLSEHQEVPTEEYIVAQNSAKDKKIDLSSQELLASKVTTNYANQQNQQSVGNSRANLQRMNLDQQTQNVLNQVLNNQQRTEVLANNNKVEAVSNHHDSTEEYTYAAKRAKSVQISTSKNQAEVTASPIVGSVLQNNTSQPTGGLNAYIGQLKKHIETKTTKDYNFKIQFTLDDKGLPSQIKFIESSDPSLEKSISNALQEGKVWNKGVDQKNIIIEIRK